jgi:hypothetical protein
MTILSNRLCRSSTVACPVLNRFKLESNHSRTWFTRKSINPLMYEARFSTQSESGMNCRSVVGTQDSLRVTRCDSIWSNDFCSRSNTTNRVEVSLPSIMRSVSKFYALVSLVSAIGLVNNSTFRGSISGSISEYPVASAIGRRVERVLTRCSVIVSVKGNKRGPGNTDAETHEIGPPSRSPTGICQRSKFATS